MMHDDEREVEEEEDIQQVLLHFAHPLNFPATVVSTILCVISCNINMIISV